MLVSPSLPRAFAEDFPWGFLEPGAAAAPGLASGIPAGRGGRRQPFDSYDRRTFHA
jgi:hypothetical protein